MKTALIGFTGFVGSNLERLYKFDDLYNSKNIADIEGREYDLVVSAANRAEMWRINQEPDVDLAEINDYIGHVSKAKIKKLVLISTVGIYKNPDGANEDTPIETDELSPYGANRYYLEQYCYEHFDTLVVRLPGLFGPGLKKNVIYDLLNHNNIDRLHADGVYQYYNLENIWRDIQIALDNNLSSVNLATPPISTKRIAGECFGIDFNNRPSDITPAHWDMHSKYAHLYNSKGSYLYSERQVLNQIKAFVEKSGA
ncbi:MAG: NAD(P)-dependent oxidoreductase [Candidatus Microsaccharimonas sp.]